MGGNNYQKRVGGSAAGGAAQGGLTGGLIGSQIMPGYGTAIGAGIGALGGGLYGGVTGDQAYHKDQKMRQRADRAGETQGLQARQGSIAAGLGGGGVQMQADVGAYNQVLAQYAALRQALEMQRMARQQQMFGQIGMLGGFFARPQAQAQTPTGSTGGTT